MDKNKRSNLLGEYIYFIKQYRMWWLVPTLVFVAILGILVITAGSQIAVALYALF